MDLTAGFSINVGLPADRDAVAKSKCDSDVVTISTMSALEIRSLKSPTSSKLQPASTAAFRISGLLSATRSLQSTVAFFQASACLRPKTPNPQIRMFIAIQNQTRVKPS